MHAQASLKIELPPLVHRQVPLGFPDGPVAQPVSFFSAGSEIYAQGEKTRAIYQVEFGAVRVYRLLADGRRQISAFHFAGETFGFEGDTMHHFFAEAVNASGLRVFRIGSGTDLSHQLLPLALKGLTSAQEHLLVLGRQNAIERVAAFLLDMADRQGDLRHIDLPMSRIDIGDYLGLTIETVSRVFSRLRVKGVIRLESLRRVEVLKRDALRAMGE